MSINLLLTSAGFEDMEGKQKSNIVDCFRKMLDKPVYNAKVLFIPTAAIDEEAKEMAGKCKSELLNLGILPENIITYDIDGSLGEDEAMIYDIIYFTGGSTRYLLQRIKETGFEVMINKMVSAGKIYLGVSAGSIIATPNIGLPQDESTGGLGLVNVYLRVHCPEYMEQKSDRSTPTIFMTDHQALAVIDKGYTLIED